MPNTAIPSDNFTPGIFVKINFNQGASTASGGQRDAILVGAMASSGTTATANTRYEITSVEQARTYFGRSPLWWALKTKLETWKGGKLYAVPHAPTSGGSPVSASATVTIATTATGAGYVITRMFGEEAVAGFKKDDSPTVIGDAVAASINAMDWPCTAANSSGTVTVTAPIAGLSQNGIYAISATITSGVGSTVTVSATTLGSGAEGSTTELSLLATALAAVVNEPDYYIGVCHKQNSTAYGHLKTHINAKMAANLSNRCWGFIAGRDAKSTLQAAAIAINHTRISLVGEPNSEYDPAYLTGLAVGWMQSAEDVDRAANVTNGFNPRPDGATWRHAPIKDISLRMTADDINDLIHDGVWAIWSHGGISKLAMSLSTRSKDSGGTIDDFRSTSSHVRSVADECAARIERRAAVTYAGYKLKNDTFDSSGKVTTVFKRGVVTPFQFKGNIMRRVILEMNDEDMLDEVELTILPSITCQIDPLNVRRIEGTLDLRVISIFAQAGIEINEVTPG